MQRHKPLKLHKSIFEQIELLRNRGLIINEDEASEILSNINYYRLSGYLHHFKKPQSDNYIPDLTFSRIIKIYKFDSRLTRILMYALENVEITFKTRFSYTLSSDFPNNPLVYIDKQIYKNEDDFKNFLNIFNKEKSNNSKLPFIKHYNKNYGKQLPIWVAVEIMTMGNLKTIYKNLQNKYQKKIAKLYNTSMVQLQNWLDNVTHIRNHLAHYMRIYQYNFGRVPMQCSKHKSFTGNGKIFDQILAISFMFFGKDEWNGYIIPEISKILDEYNNYVLLNDIGFPENWKEILTIN